MLRECTYALLVIPLGKWETISGACILYMPYLKLFLISGFVQYDTSQISMNYDTDEMIQIGIR